MKKKLNPPKPTKKILQKTSEEGRDLTGIPETFCFRGCRVGLWSHAHAPDGGTSPNQHLPVRKVSLHRTRFIFLVPLLSYWECIDLPLSINEQTSLAGGMQLVIYVLTSYRLLFLQGASGPGMPCTGQGLLLCWDGGTAAAGGGGQYHRDLLRCWEIPEQSSLQLRKSSCSL